MGIQYEHFVAGTLGGFISTAVVHPLDLVKVRFAANEGNQLVRPQYNNSYFSLASEIWRGRGFRGFYQGATPNLIGNASAWGVYFLVYNALKDAMKKFPKEQLTAAHHLGAGVLAGAVTLTFTNPIWVAKTRLCLQYEHRQQQYSGMLSCLAQIFRKEGFRGWYKGYLPGLVGTTHGALQFMAYEEFKKVYSTMSGKSVDGHQGSLQYIVFGASSKGFATSLTYPYQVVRTRLQDQHVHYNGVSDVVRQTWRRQGFWGFYKGLLPSLLRVMPATAVTFVVYENVRYFLQQQSTRPS